MIVILSYRYDPLLAVGKQKSPSFMKGFLLQFTGE